MNDSVTSYDAAARAAQSIKTSLPDQLQRPHIGIVCGSGLGGLQHTVIQATDAPRYELAYERVPGMPVPSGT